MDQVVQVSEEAAVVLVFSMDTATIPREWSVNKETVSLVVTPF